MKNQKAFYKEIGRRICDARKRRKPKMTQQVLADRVKLTRTSITNMEKGRQKFLLHTLYDIAFALKVEAASLLPKLEREDEERLEAAIKDFPSSASSWIRSTVTNAETERKA